MSSVMAVTMKEQQWPRSLSVRHRQHRHTTMAGQAYGVQLEGRK